MAKYTLEQIKSHPDFPFYDFMENPLSFLMLELYWSQLFAELVGTNDNDWEPTTIADTDGNPIFGATSLPLLRKVRVIHNVNEENYTPYPESTGENTYYPVQPWLNNSVTVDGSTELNELVLLADLSAEAEKQASNLLRLHCLDLVDEETMEKVISDYEMRIGMPGCKAQF